MHVCILFAFMHQSILDGAPIRCSSSCSLLFYYFFVSIDVISVDVCCTVLAELDCSMHVWVNACMQVHVDW